jgi:hypothetical protein
MFPTLWFVLTDLASPERLQDNFHFKPIFELAIVSYQTGASSATERAHHSPTSMKSAPRLKLSNWRSTDMKKSFVHGTRQKQHGYSAAVVTEGASRIVWLAGHSGQTADDGRSLAGDFDAQSGRHSATSKRRFARLDAN